MPCVLRRMHPGMHEIISSTCSSYTLRTSHGRAQRQMRAPQMEECLPCQEASLQTLVHPLQANRLTGLSRLLQLTYKQIFTWQSCVLIRLPRVRCRPLPYSRTSMTAPVASKTFPLFPLHLVLQAQ